MEFLGNAKRNTQRKKLNHLAYMCCGVFGWSQAAYDEADWEFVIMLAEIHKEVNKKKK